MSEELKPCSKCGGSDFWLMRIQEVQGLEWYQVSCDDCGQVAAWSTSIDEAVCSWNEEA